MAATKMKELRGKEPSELALEMENLRKELFDLRFQSTTEKIPNPSRISEIKKTVARIHTIQREREIEAAKSGAAQPAAATEGGEA